MNRLTSLLQVRQYTPKLLNLESYQTLDKSLKFFIPDTKYNKLSWTYWFKKDDYSQVLEKMNRIGWAAD